MEDCINLIQEKNNSNKKVNFLIVFDENPNAFINEKRVLFITTGLLKYIPSYEALIGVLAHELGHLDNYHIIKRIDSIKYLRSLNQFGTLSMIATSILAKNADYLVKSIFTNQVGIKNYYSAFSREQEREADIYAVQTLNKLYLSPEPLKKFLKILEKKSFQKGLNEENFKFLSHPVYKERFNIIQNLSNKQQYIFDQKFSNRFYFAKAKLFGFTEINDNKLHEYLDGDYYNYAKSIILSRNGMLKESLIILNKLINKYHGNYFLMETKADLLLTHGYESEANKFYKKVINNDNNNKYVKKRIFEIEYKQIIKTNNIMKKKFFEDYSNLLMIFPNNVLLQKKFKKLAVSIDKYEWVNFINANILIINRKNNDGLEIFRNILLTSQDEKLIKFTKRKIRLISNE